MHKLAKLTFALSTAGAVVLLYCASSHTSSLSSPQSSLHSGQPAILIAADPPDDPGKDITPDPHGSDPHDENHDPDLPANNPDKYLPAGK